MKRFLSCVFLFVIYVGFLSWSASAQQGLRRNGFIQIESSPKALVTIDGKEIGYTPITYEVSTGTHHVNLSSKKHETYHTIVEVRAGETVYVGDILNRKSRPGHNIPLMSITMASAGMDRYGHPSVGVLLGQVSGVGGYVHFLSSLSGGMKPQFECHISGLDQNGVFHNCSDYKHCFNAVSGGVIVNVKRLSFLAGAGYFHNDSMVKDSSDEWGNITEYSYKGLGLDAGVIFRLGKLAVGVSVTTPPTDLSFLTTSLSLGVNF